MEESKVQYPSPKTQILLPFIFAFTTLLVILMLANSEFAEGWNFVTWLYFGIVLGYCAIAIVDLFLNKNRSKKQRIFIMVMLALTIIIDITFAIVYVMVGK